MINAHWRADYPMSRLSSWRAGGAARWLFTPADAGELGDARARAGDAPLLFVGHGSNLLVRDGGFDGVVVRSAPGLAALRVEEDGRVFAGAGVGCPKLARFCAARGLRGGEFFAGIPGTVGGALAMNAGCHGGETWARVHSALVITAAGKTEERRRDAFDISYRHVQSGDAPFFAGAWFRFARGCAAAARDKIRALLKQRGKTQPLAQASAGSVFCNPPDDFAGRLIEACGLKGARVGDAEVSPVHANFIVNRGAATADDIEALILLVRRRVADAAGVVLRLEVRIVGEAA